MSRRLLIALVASTALLGACSVRMTRTPTTASAAEGIRAVLDSSAAGWNRGDLDAYLGLYAPDVTSASGNGFVAGRDSAEAVMRRGFWRTGRPVQQLHYEHLDTRLLGADHALVTGQFVLTGAGRPDRTGWFTTIWRRTPAGWRCIHDHS